MEWPHDHRAIVSIFVCIPHKGNPRGDYLPQGEPPGGLRARCLQERRSGQIFHLMVPSRGLPQAQERPPARGRRSLLDEPRANPGSGAPGLPQQRSIDIERREMKRSFVYRST